MQLGKILKEQIIIIIISKHDWVGKVIHREMCKKLKFDHINKWYMHEQYLS